ncbi:MAG: hypothetical protein WAK48_05770 [Candidatus Acidiferrum sp.]|jgi:hypothetical protein
MAEQPSGHGSKQEHKLFSVMGWIVQGHTVELIVAKSEADAEYYAIHELGFVKVDGTAMISDHVHVGPMDTKE